jgi:hypothetical protein
MSAASAGSIGGSARSVKGSEPGRKSMPRLGPGLAAISSWISGSGSACPSSGAMSTTTSSGTGSPIARASSPASTSATSAPRPWPAPVNFVTYMPRSSASTSPGSEPPSRRAST